MSLALCPQTVSQAPQHIRSSETQATCDSYFPRQSICSVVSVACPGQYSRSAGVFDEGCACGTLSHLACQSGLAIGPPEEKVAGTTVFISHNVRRERRTEVWIRTHEEKGEPKSGFEPTKRKANRSLDLTRSQEIRHYELSFKLMAFHRHTD